MVGVLNRLPHVVCEVGTCFTTAAFTEYIVVVPGDPALKNERHAIDIVLCHRHDADFQRNGLGRGGLPQPADTPAVKRLKRRCVNACSEIGTDQPDGPDVMVQEYFAEVLEEYEILGSA